MRSTVTAPMLVAASKAIQEALAAAELTTDERVLRVRFGVVCRFAKVAFVFFKTLERATSFLELRLSRFRASG